MNTPTKALGLLFVSVAVVSLLLVLPIWQQDTEAKDNKAKVQALIAVGQTMDAAQGQLSEAGFELLYDEPIMPTASQDYLQQAVIVGQTQPNIFESLAHAAGVQWMPFTRAQSPYVLINADLNGVITAVD